MPRRPILPLAVALLALAPSAAPAATTGTTFLTGGLDLPAGAIAGGFSGYALERAARMAVSDDGRYVAFVSDADLLDPAANPDTTNVYRKDAETGAVELVSRATGADGAAPALPSFDAAISDDGSRVAFLTAAALDPADADGGEYDVYVRDLDDDTTELASVGDGTRGAQTLAEVDSFDLSGNGALVAFATADRVTTSSGSDGNTAGDVFLRNVDTDRTALVSRRSGSNTTSLLGAADEPSVSDDGRWVAFVSTATDLVSSYVGSGEQAFVRDMTNNNNGATAGTALVSNRSTLARTASSGDADTPDVAGTPGALSTVVVAYVTSAIDVAVGAPDASASDSVYVRRMSATSSTLVSVDDRGANADSRAHTPSISDDGTRVEFDSDADNLTADPEYYGVYLRDLTAGRTLLASVDTRYSVQGELAGGGGYVGFYAGNGVTPDSDPDAGGIFGRAYAPTAMGAPAFLSRPPGTAPFLLPAIVMSAEGAGERTVSADGRYVVFAAANGSRLPGGTPGGPGQIYRRDLLTGGLELVSRATGPDGAAAAGFSSQPTISADGLRVAFATSSQLDPAHPASVSQAYVRDLAANTTMLVSREDGDGTPANDGVLHPRISADGRHVAFVSAATSLGVGGGSTHVYLRDTVTGTLTVVDRANGADGAFGNAGASDPSPSADGRRVAFVSSARNLDPADAADLAMDVYVRDTVAHTTTLVSRRSGPGGADAGDTNGAPAISADGTVVAFVTADETLATEAGGWGGRRQIVARTLATGANRLVSRAPGDGAPGNDDADRPTVSGDGGVIAFESDATNLLPGLGGVARPSVFARTVASGALAGPPAFGLVDSPIDDGAWFPAISDDGNCLAFRAHGHNAITGIAGDFDTGYMHVLGPECPTPPALVTRPRPPPPRARAAPRPNLTGASLLRKRFRVGRAATARTASGAARAAARRGRARRVRSAPAGTAFRFRLNTPARVTIAIEHAAPGRLVGRFCRRPGPRLRRNLRCVRFVEDGRLVRTGVRAGRASVVFSGRIGSRALPPRAYRARLRAGNGSGVSRWVRLGFRVVRR